MRCYIFEGADNVGKTTLIKAVSKHLDNCLVIKEPGGRDALLAEGFDPQKLGASYPSLRELCVNDTHIPERARRAVFLADSLYQEAVITLPALAAGKLILSDRSWVSDLAYGSVFTSLTLDALYTFNMSLRKRIPAHVFYLYLPPEEREQRYSVANKMDSKAAGIQDELDTVYRTVLDTYFSTLDVTILNTSESVDALTAKVLKTIGGIEAP